MGLGQRVDRHERRQVDAEGREQRLRVHQRQRAAPARRRLREDAFRRREIGRLRVGLRRRNLEQPFLVEAIRREERKRFHRILRRVEIGDPAGLQRVVDTLPVERAEPRRQHELGGAPGHRRDGVRGVDGAA